MGNKRTNPTPKNAKFKVDNEWGTYWEWETINFIQDYFNKVLNPKNKRLEFHCENFSTKQSELKEWDMKYAIIDTQTNKPIKHITFEIKADRFDLTGNLIFEKTCSKKDSGVFATKADYFVYYMPRYQKDNFYICKPEHLKKVLLENFAQCLTFGVGDGGRATGFLVSKQTFDESYTATASNKLLTCELPIPDKFNVKKFDAVKTSTYYGSTIDTKEDIFKWK